MTTSQNANSAASSIPAADIYRAARQDKPWGYELIFAAVDGKYVGKIIHVNAGGSLSLQYHREKEETISVLSGEALIEHGPAADQLTDERFGSGTPSTCPRACCTGSRPSPTWTSPRRPRPRPAGARTWSGSRTGTAGTGTSAP